MISPPQGSDLSSVRTEVLDNWECAIRWRIPFSAFKGDTTLIVAGPLRRWLQLLRRSCAAAAAGAAERLVLPRGAASCYYSSCAVASTF